MKSSRCLCKFHELEINQFCINKLCCSSSRLMCVSCAKDYHKECRNMSLSEEELKQRVITLPQQKSEVDAILSGFRKQKEQIIELFDNIEQYLTKDIGLELVDQINVSTYMSEELWQNGYEMLERETSVMNTITQQVKAALKYMKEITNSNRPETRDKCGLNKYDRSGKKVGIWEEINPNHGWFCYKGEYVNGQREGNWLIVNRDDYSIIYGGGKYRSGKKIEYWEKPNAQNGFYLDMGSYIDGLKEGKWQIVDLFNKLNIRETMIFKAGKLVKKI